MYRISKKALSFLLSMAMLVSLCVGMTINASASATSSVWDGTTASSYAGGSGTETDPYEIATAEQLALLASQVNAGKDCSGLYFALTADILLNSDGSTANVWPAIGGQTAPFNGTFDGKGHYVCNLYVYAPNDGSVTHKGLFGSVDGSGTVKNVGVTGTVGAYRYAAGIAGYNSGTIENCFNAASITGNDSGTRGSGGIVGVNAGKIINCYNVGTVDNLYRPAGGIAGIAEEASELPSGMTSSDIVFQNCYSVGKITSAGGTGYEGAITATQNGSTITNCFYLDGSAPYAVAYKPSTTGVTSEADMKAASFPAKLGGAFVADTNNYNNGYPILSWQDHAIPTAPDTPVTGDKVTFTVTGAESIAAMTTDTGSVSFSVTPTVNAAVTAVTVPASSGATVTKTSTGYTISGISGDLAVNVTVSSTGDYTIASAASGLVEVTASAATIDGSSVANQGLLIDCTAQDTALTINNLTITNGNTSVIDFGTTASSLNFTGTNLLEGEATNYAAVRTGAGGSLTIGGTGTLYLYKYSLAAGIGGNSGEGNGDITITSGNIFAKGSMTGAVIGTGANAKSAGTITIKGGQLNLASVSNGAVIGGGVGGAISTVTMTGGNINIVCDWNGAGIGVGTTTTTAGNLYINGASLYVSSTSNRDSTAPLITTTITSSASSTTPLYVAAIPVPAASASGTFEVLIDYEEACYTGTVNNWTFQNVKTSTEANWTANTADEVYIYLPGEDCTATIGDTDYTCTFSNGAFIVS